MNRTFRVFREMVCLKLVLKVSGIWTEGEEGKCISGGGDTAKPGVGVSREH